MSGVSQPSPLAAAQHHAQALAAAGNLNAAQLTLLQAVEEGRAHLGEDDPAVLATVYQLAAVHREAGDWFAARRALEEAFTAGQWRLGESDPLMLALSFDLGLVAEELGNRHEARKAFGRVAGLGPAVLGADHPAVTRAREYLGEDPPTGRREMPPQVGHPSPASGPPLAQPGRGYEASPPVPDTAGRVQQVPARQGWEVAATPHATPTAPPAPHEQGALQRVQNLPDRRPPAERAADRWVSVDGLAATDFPGAEQRFTPRVQRSAPAFRAEVRPGGRGPGPAIFAAIAASVAAVIAVVTLVVVMSNRGETQEREPEAPTLGGGQPPQDVRLSDRGATVEMSWTDPTGGSVSFIVTGGRPGELLKSMGQVGPGKTSLELFGLNPELDYCFAVVAVYSANTFSPSPQSCTARKGAASVSPSTG